MRSVPKLAILTALLLLMMMMVALPQAQAQPESVLYNFCSQPNCTDGANPASSLTPDAAGNFYGTTQLGGANTDGTVYELSPNGSGGYNESVLYSFCSLQNCADGSYPYSYVTFDAHGNLYGTTYFGGLLASGPYSGYGLVFELSPKPPGGCPSGSNPGNAWCETVLYSFTSNPDGAFPFAGLTFDPSGNLYGTTYSGGSGIGTVYELSPNGKGAWTEQVIYDRGGYAGLTIDSSGNLYGADGSDAEKGHVFKLSSNGSGGWTATILHTFTAARTDGNDPEGTPVLDSAGNIYGTTFKGGATLGMGTVWKLTPGPSGEYAQNILHNFIWSYGSNPKAGVVLDSSGNIYSTTAFGIHQSPCYDGCGTVFEMANTASNYNDSNYNASNYNASNHNDPNHHASNHDASDNGDSVTSDSNYEWTFLWSFKGTDGGNPIGTLIFDAGNLYGTTYGGGKSSYCPGAGGCGVAFELNPLARVTTTVLTSSPNPSTQGEPVTFTAVVTPAPPDGETLTFKTSKLLGTAPLSGGTAVFTTSTLPVGTPHVKAVYGGDRLFEDSTSNGVQQVVQR